MLKSEKIIAKYHLKLFKSVVLGNVELTQIAIEELKFDFIAFTNYIIESQNT